MQLAKRAADSTEASSAAPYNILSQAYEGLTVKVRASINLRSKFQGWTTLLNGFRAVLAAL